MTTAFEAGFDSGLPGVSLESGDHICAFYTGLEERDEILLPYLRAGLSAGDKCICVVDAGEPATVLAGVGADVGADTSQIDVMKSTETYLRLGHFSTTSMLAFWDNAVSDALEGGFPFFRAVGEMTWALRDAPGVDELFTYESELNRFGPQYPQVLLCMYDLHRFRGDVMVDLLKTHPKLLLGGMVLDNPHYLSPDEFLATRT
jgi:hypothetical protein